MGERRESSAKLVKLFRAMDFSRDGYVTKMEWEKALMRDPRAQEMLANLKMTPQQTLSVYDVLDADENGSLSLDEFVPGILNGRGTTRIFDVWSMQSDLWKAFARMETLVAAITEQRRWSLSPLSPSRSAAGSPTAGVGEAPSGVHFKRKDVPDEQCGNTSTTAAEQTKSPGIAPTRTDVTSGNPPLDDTATRIPSCIPKGSAEEKEEDEEQLRIAKVEARLECVEGLQREFLGLLDDALGETECE